MKVESRNNNSNKMKMMMMEWKDEKNIKAKKETICNWFVCLFVIPFER